MLPTIKQYKYIKIEIKTMRCTDHLELHDVCYETRLGPAVIVKMELQKWVIKHKRTNKYKHSIYMCEISTGIILCIII